MKPLNIFFAPFSSLAMMLLAIGIGAVSSSSNAHAQSGTLIGLDLRIHQVSHSGGFRTINAMTPLFEDGTGFGQSVGLEIRHRASSTWGISGALFYNRLPGLFEQTLHNPQGNELAITSAEGGPDTAETERTILLASDIRYSTISLEAMAEWLPLAKEGSWSIGVAAGPTLSYTLAATLKQTASIEEPVYTRFENPNQYPSEANGRTIIFYEGDLLKPNKLRLGMEGGIFAEFEKLIPGVILSPGIFYNYGLTSVTETENWELSALTGQISLLMKL